MNANDIESAFAEDFDFNNPLFDEATPRDSEDEMDGIPSGNAFKLVDFTFKFYGNKGHGKCDRKPMGVNSKLIFLKSNYIFDHTQGMGELLQS